MSVEIERKIIKTHRTLTAGDTQATMDTDIIVPDINPDVKVVLQAEVVPYISGKHIQKGYITLTGSMDYNILYLSDEKECAPSLKAINTRIPFTHQLKVPDAESHVFAGIKADLINVEFSMVNSRKINVKCVVDFESNVLMPDEFEAVSAVYAEGDLPCRSRSVSSFAVVDFAENEFEAGGLLSIPSGSDMIDEILKVDARVAGREVKCINGKPVAKGAAVIHALYTDTSGQLRTIEGEIPFTEVLDVDTVDEGNICEAEYSITDLRYGAAADSDGDMALLDVTVCISAAAGVYTQAEEALTIDLYSPDFDVSAARDSVCVNRLVCAGKDISDIRDSVQLPAGAPPISEIYNVITKPYVESAVISGGKAHISGIADTYLMYTTPHQDTPFFSFKKEIPFSYSVPADCGEDAHISVICDADDISCSATSASSAEVRFRLNFDTKIIEEEEIVYIKDVEADEASASERGEMPGIVIYFAAAGESMWDIAKRYHTTAEAISAANKSELPEILTEPRQIMIPRRKIG